jgi:hypothetical protein
MVTMGPFQRLPGRYLVTTKILSHEVWERTKQAMRGCGSTKHDAAARDFRHKTVIHRGINAMGAQEEEVTAEILSNFI